MPETALEMIVAGDLVLDEPDAGYWMAGIAPAIQAADLAIAHLEVPHTRRGQELEGDVPAPGAPPENVQAIAEAGFDIVSLAGNHVSDCGSEGIEDTIAALDAAGIRYAGAGANIAAASRPAIVERNGIRIALLSYNCVGPENGWATADRAGAAYLRIDTADGSPIAPAARLEHVSDEALATLSANIAAARNDAELVLVALHKGLVHVPARLASYEQPLSHAAIDSGADAVLGHHAHILRGIEFYRGKLIFHGLGNACVVTSALSPAQDHPARREWAERRKRMFGFKPDPAYTLAPFHPEAVNGFLGRLRVKADGTLEAGIVPVHVEAPGRPILAEGERASQIRAYVERITVAAGLPPIAIGDDGMVRQAS